MEAAHYVNSSVIERSRRGSSSSGHSSSGGSSLYRVVGVSFGLLCIVQSALNVSLRLHYHLQLSQTGLFNRSDSNSSCDLTQELRAVTSERDQLLQEKLQLAAERDALNQRFIELQYQEGKTRPPQAPPRNLQTWWWHQSSYYQLSTSADTWEQARRDCEEKGAHLVILDSEEEEQFVIYVLKSAFGPGGDLSSAEMWISLSRGRWEDGRLLDPDRRATPRCVFVARRSGAWSWFLHSCKKRHLWMCELEISRISAP